MVLTKELGATGRDLLAKLTVVPKGPEGTPLDDEDVVGVATKLDVGRIVRQYLWSALSQEEERCCTRLGCLTFANIASSSKVLLAIE